MLSAGFGAGCAGLAGADIEDELGSLIAMGPSAVLESESESGGLAVTSLATGSASWGLGFWAMIEGLGFGLASSSSELEPGGTLGGGATSFLANGSAIFRRAGGCDDGRPSSNKTATTTRARASSRTNDGFTR